MKAKVFYLVCYALALGAVVASVVLIARAAFESGRVTVRQTGLSVGVPRGPEPEIFQKVRELEPILPSLARPRSTGATKVDLEAFGYRKTKQSSGSLKGPKMKLKREFTHSVSFAFCGERKCFCVVDGTFYPEGARLGRGGRILKILPRKVLIEEGRTRKWFPVGAGIKKEQSADTEPRREN